MKNFSEKSWKRVKEDLYKRQGKALVKKTGSDSYVKLDKFSIGGEVKNVVIGKTVPHYEDWRDGITYFSPKGMFRFRAMLHDNGFVADDDAFGGRDTKGKYSLYLDQITWGMPIRSSVPCDTMWYGLDEIICSDPWEEHNFLRDENGERKEFENYTKFQEYLKKNWKNTSLKNKITIVKDGTSYRYFLLISYSKGIGEHEIESLWQDYAFIPFAPRIIFPYKDMQPISHANYVEKYPEDEQNYSQPNKYYIGGKGGDSYEYFEPDYDWPCNTTYDYSPSYGYSLKSSAMVPVYNWKYNWTKYKYQDWSRERDNYDNYDDFYADNANIRLMPYKRLGLEIILDSHPDWQPNINMAIRNYKCKFEDVSGSTKFYDIYGEFLEHYPNYSGYTDTDNEFGCEWGIHDWVLDLKNKWHWSSEINGCDVIVEFQFPPIIYKGKRYPINAITKSNGRVYLMHLDSGEGTSPYLRVDGGRVTCTKPFPSIVNTDNISFMEWKDYYTLPHYDYEKFTSGECVSYPSEFKEFISNPKKCLVLNKKKTLTRSSIEYLRPSDAQSYEEGDKYGYNWGDTDEIWLTGGDGKGYKIIAGNTSNSSIRYMPTSYTGAPATYKHYYYYRRVNDKHVTDEMRKKKVVLDSVPTSFPVNSPSAPKYVGIECAKSYVQLNTGKTNYSTYVTTEMENTAPRLSNGVPPVMYEKIEEPSDSIKNSAMDGIIYLYDNDGVGGFNSILATFKNTLDTTYTSFQKAETLRSWNFNVDTIYTSFTDFYHGHLCVKSVFDSLPTIKMLDSTLYSVGGNYWGPYGIISTQNRKYYKYNEETGKWEEVRWDDIDKISGDTLTEIYNKQRAMRLGLLKAMPTDYIYYKYDDEIQQYIQDSGLTDEQKASSIEVNFIPEAKSSVISAISYTSITESGALVRNSADTPTYIHISGVYSPSYYNNDDLFDKTKYYYTKEITGYYKLQNNYDNKYVAYGGSDWDSTNKRYWRNYYVLKEYDFYELKEVEGYESMIIMKNRKYEGRYSILLGRNHTTAHYNVRYSRSRRNPLDGEDEMKVKITCHDGKHDYKDYYKQVFLNESITSSNGKLGKAHSNTFYKKIIPLHRGYKSIYQKNITVHRRKNIFFY